MNVNLVIGNGIAARIGKCCGHTACNEAFYRNTIRAASTITKPMSLIGIAARIGKRCSLAVCNETDVCIGIVNRLW